MNSKFALIGIVTLTTLAFATDSALAMPNSQQVLHYCDSLGGTFFAPNGNGVYGCLLSSRVFVCGGGNGCRWYR
jgi:hypothetical protein